MRIFYDHQIFSNSGYGGVSRYFVELASRVGRFPGADVSIVAPIVRSWFLAEKKEEVAIIGLDLSSARRLPTRLIQRVNGALFRALALASPPDLVHETWYSLKSRVPRSAKVVTTIHDTIPERFPSIFRHKARSIEEKRKALDRADHVICVSKSTRNDLIELYDFDIARTSVVPLASSLAAPTEGPMEPGFPYFLYVGARSGYKNFRSLLQAFGSSELYRTHKLVAFGSQPLSPDELAVMQRAGVPEHTVVQTSGDDTQLARYYAGAEALVFPSLYEGFGIPLLEAMTCGCPVLSSNTSSLPEVAGDAALYFDPSDASSIAHALLEIASSQETRSHLIAKGKLRAQQFSWDRCASETYRIYQSLAD